MQRRTTDHMSHCFVDMSHCDTARHVQVSTIMWSVIVIGHPSEAVVFEFQRSLGHESICDTTHT